MDVIYYPDDQRLPGWRRPVVALGNFDGLHRGHAKIIERVHRSSGEHGSTSVAMTFEPHPPRIVRPDKAPPLLMTAPQKLEALEHAGMQGVAVIRFTHELSQWEPETFVRQVLVQWLGAFEVWVGANFLFGHDRSGNFSLLRMLGLRYGFRAEKIDAVRYKDFVVSSTRIRRLISEGRVDEAAALLGHHYSIDGTVVEGDRRGRAIGFPTANLQTVNELVPPNGVYATLARTDGSVKPSLTNIGVRPTFAGNSQVSIETHVLDFDRDLYGEPMRLYFVQRLRDERAFDNVDALRKQIASDCDHAMALFRRISL